MSESPDTPLSFPLLSLHPVGDARHRWVAVLIECSPANAQSNLIPALEHWLGSLGLRESLGKLPCILPAQTLTALRADLPPSIAAGPSLLRVELTGSNPGGATDTTLLATLDAGMLAQSPGARLLLSGPLSGNELPRCVQACTRPWDDSAAPGGCGPGPHVALAVRTMEDFTASQSAGWLWAAGNYAQHPATAGPQATGSGRAIMLKLMGQITRDADDADIEKTLKQDPNLSYQLLRLVNSVAFSLRTPISSFGQALIILGRRQLQRWLQLLLYAQQGNAPLNPLMPIAAWRAGLMENLAKDCGLPATVQDEAFMVGMFSRLDVLFGQTLAQIIAPLGLAAEVSEALLTRTGRLGPLLEVVETAERMADSPDAAAPAGSALAGQLTRIGLTPEQWAQAQARSLPWAIQISQGI